MSNHIYQSSTKLMVLSILIFVLRIQIILGLSVERDLLLNGVEKDALIKFRRKVSPLLYRDFMKYDIFLVRWLRAKNFNLASAEEMLRTHMKWRKEHKIDTILEEDWSDMKADYYATTDTYDKTGRPILAMSVGDWDVRSGMLRGQGPRLLRYVEYLLEDVTMKVFEQQRKGLNVTQWIALNNAEGFSLVLHASPVSIRLWIQTILAMDSNYPGWMDKIVIFNAPTTISVVLDATRPFMSQYTRNVLKVLGQNQNRWMKYLDEYIAKEQRTPPFGGTKPMEIL